MIWSPDRNYLFIHIPKTGGTSLALALEARAMKDDVMLGDTPKALKRRRRVAGVASAGRLWKHSTLADLDGLVPSADLDDLFVFTLVRNPWDRVVSYYHWLRDQRFDHPAVGLAQALDFTEFVLHSNTIQSLAIAQASSYVTDYSGRERCDAFIRIEAFADDAQPLMRHLGFTLDLPHENTSNRKSDWRVYYTDDSARAVGQACKNDIERFGYSFDPAPPGKGV